MFSDNLAIDLRHALHPIYRGLETIVHPLRYLFLEITQKCNLNCLHCGSDCSRATSMNELTTDDWLKLIDYIADNFTSPKPLLVITGGEPLCHNQLDTIVERIRKRGLQFGIVTNGYLLNRKNVTRLLQMGITSITVSLDGKKQSHDWLRGVPGSFERAIRGIRYLAESDIQFFDVVTCANPRNLLELSEITELLRDIGVKRQRIFSIFPKGRAKENPDLFLSHKQLKQLLEWIEQTRRKLEHTGFHLDFSCEGFLPAALDRAVRNEPYFCRAGISIASVLCDGSISACPNIAKTFVQGNIVKDDLKAVWENRFELLRNRQWMKTGRCTKCKQWNRCKGNSLHLWDDEAKQTVLCHHNALQYASTDE